MGAGTAKSRNANANQARRRTGAPRNASVSPTRRPTTPSACPPRPLSMVDAAMSQSAAATTPAPALARRVERLGETRSDAGIVGEERGRALEEDLRLLELARLEHEATQRVARLPEVRVEPHGVARIVDRVRRASAREDPRHVVQ